MTQDQHIDKFLQSAYTEGANDERKDQLSGYAYSFDLNWISLPVDAFGSDQKTVFRLAIFESLSLGNSRDVGLTEVCFEFHPSISVGYVKGVLAKWGCVFTSDLEESNVTRPIQPACTGDCGKCSPAEVHECHLKRNAKN